jgi:UDP-galactopyranose mutase
MKSYEELPAYLAGWNVAMLPFALNESTRFISPTKTPEYLAAGKPVVSTSIRDVVRPYGMRGLVEIADTPADFVDATERLLGGDADEGWLASVDAFLAQMSWDATFSRMRVLIDEADAKPERDAQVANQVGASVIRRPFGRLSPATAADTRSTIERS